MSDFVSPNFTDRCLEFRFVDDEVCIYATKDGLEWLAAKCAKLAARKFHRGETTHLHIEDYEVLTKESLPAVLARFET